MFEMIPVNLTVLIMSTLGAPGLIVLFWYVDHQRFNHILTKYKEDMDTMSQMYKNNVALVKGYERLADDLTGIITLNTQTLTTLVEQVKNNNTLMWEKRGNR